MKFVIPAAVAAALLVAVALLSLSPPRSSPGQATAKPATKTSLATLAERLAKAKYVERLPGGEQLTVYFSDEQLNQRRAESTAIPESIQKVLDQRAGASAAVKADIDRHLLLGTIWGPQEYCFEQFIYRVVAVGHDYIEIETLGNSESAGLVPLAQLKWIQFFKPQVANKP